jgi:hypothetical protein
MEPACGTFRVPPAPRHTDLIRDAHQDGNRKRANPRRVVHVWF